MTNNPQVSFNRAAVRPMECLKTGWALIKPQYWLFFGITAVGMLIASLVPFGILMGPMMCGIYLAFFQARRNQPIEFGIVFKGFDYFGQSLIASLIHIVPILIVVVPTYIIFYAALIMMSTSGSQDPSTMLVLMGVFGLVWLLIFILILVVSVLFTFSYPLIVDRGLSGVDAVKLSAKAAMANFGRLLGLYVINAGLTLVGILFCYVGAFFVLPITIAGLAMAYEQVFGLGEPASNLPPPPPSF